MSEQEEEKLGKPPQMGEHTTERGTESEVPDQQPTTPRGSSIKSSSYSPARDTHSTFFEASPLESPLLPEQSHTRTTTPRHFNPPLPVSPSSSIFRKDSKKKPR